MEWIGELSGIYQDYETGKFKATFTLDGVGTVNFLNGLFHQKLGIKVGRYKEKRSLDANAYCWVLISKIAEVIKSSKEEVYEEMLQKYGYFYQDDEGYITVTVKASVDMSKIQGHWKFYKSNGKFNSYVMIKGTSEYNTVEMAHFIDMVVQEAKGLYIETMPPAELERMKASWK